MASTRNPFHPGFGVSPPLLVGREEVLEDAIWAIEDGLGSPGRVTLYTGVRGVGKTVLLNAVENEARSRGWVVLSETASRGFVRRLIREGIPRRLAERNPKSVRRHFTGVTGSFDPGDATSEPTDAQLSETNLCNHLELLTDLLAEEDEGRGVLITLDEVNHHQMEELGQLDAAIQHAFREDRDVMLVGAGLASSVSRVLGDSSLSILRRAERHVLTCVDRTDAERAIREPVEAAGRRVSASAVRAMANGTEGYPYLIQLVGAHCWRVHRDAPEISIEDAHEGVADAQRRLGSLVHGPSLAGVSAVDRSFLLAMATDDRPSKLGDIAARMGVSVGYASQYRRRLIAAELIRPAAYGHVEFALPHLREYLREQGTAEG